MTERVEQRYCIKFCQKLGDTQTETIHKIQQAFGNNAMGVTQIKEWFNRFKDGRTSVDSDQRSGRPSTSRNPHVIDQVRSLIKEGRQLTVREIANAVNISKGSIYTLLKVDLGMRRVFTEFVPEQRAVHVDVEQDMLVGRPTNGDPDLKIIITGDESWVYKYDPQTRDQCTSPASPKPEKARQQFSSPNIIRRRLRYKRNKPPAGEHAKRKNRAKVAKQGVEDEEEGEVLQDNDEMDGKRDDHPAEATNGLAETVLVKAEPNDDQYEVYINTDKEEEEDVKPEIIPDDDVVGNLHMTFAKPEPGTNNTQASVEPLMNLISTDGIKQEVN